jgi:hypothetical protein
MNHVPVSTRSPMAMAASASAVHTAAVSPKLLSFIRAIASSSPPTGMMPTTGPKTSSCISGIE